MKIIPGAIRHHQTIAVAQVAVPAVFQGHRGAEIINTKKSKAHQSFITNVTIAGLH